ncbi:hypothetical protein DRQ27_02135 [bacterium]|mgnify:CR=1 FL=1|nr:MAG: hypothetical protein DRQ27_02135 [bacterium]
MAKVMVIIILFLILFTITNSLENYKLYIGTPFYYNGIKMCSCPGSGGCFCGTPEGGEKLDPGFYPAQLIFENGKEIYLCGEPGPYGCYITQ